MVKHLVVECRLGSLMDLWLPLGKPFCCCQRNEMPINKIRMLLKSRPSRDIVKGNITAGEPQEKAVSGHRSHSHASLKHGGRIGARIYSQWGRLSTIFCFGSQWITVAHPDLDTGPRRGIPSLKQCEGSKQTFCERTLSSVSML